MPRTPQPFFSVVIPTLNEEKYLPRLLENLSKQTFSEFEVTVVDGSSEDETVKEAKKWQKKLDLQVLTIKERNVSIQRNTGIDKSSGEWVIFMDADNQLPEYFLEGVRYQLSKNPDTDIFTTWASADSESRFDKVMENAFNLTIELYDAIGKSQGIGAMLGVRRSILQDIRFDESQKYLEDGFLVKEICEAGHQFQIFRDPRFMYSLRRIKKEGNLKMLQTVVKYQLHYLLGGDFSQPFSATNYPMYGGSYYDDEDGEVKQERWFTGMQHFIKNASQQQLERAKRVLEMLKNLEM